MEKTGLRRFKDISFREVGFGEKNFFSSEVVNCPHQVISLSFGALWLACLSISCP